MPPFFAQMVIAQTDFNYFVELMKERARSQRLKQREEEQQGESEGKS